MVPCSGAGRQLREPCLEAPLGLEVSLPRGCARCRLEELDVARDLLGGVRDYYQAKIAEQQNEVAKKLTVSASLVLVPSFIVGFFGQNFAGEFRAWYWGIGISVGLIVATTIVQLALFRWRHWL